MPILMDSKNLCVREVGTAILRAPLVCPFRIAYGQHNYLKNVIFYLKLADGTKGYGEAAIATHITGETPEQTEKNLKETGRDLIGADISDCFRLSARLSERLSGNKSALAAIEMALMDALAKKMKVPLWKFFGGRPNRLVTDITVVIAEPQETEAAVKRFFAEGFRKFKIKLAGRGDEDFRRVSIVKKFAPSAQICLDANQSFSAKEALKFLRLLARFDIHPAMIEQPVDRRDWDGLKEVTRLSKVPVCADESIGSISDCLRLILERGADIINIKLMKFGLFEGRRIASLAGAAGLKLMIGSMMESSLAVTAAAHFAAGLGGFDFVDLDTPFFIEGRYGRNPYLNSRGVYDLRGVRSGIGITPPTGN